MNTGAISRSYFNLAIRVFIQSSNRNGYWAKELGWHGGTFDCCSNSRMSEGGGRACLIVKLEITFTEFSFSEFFIGKSMATKFNGTLLQRPQVAESRINRETMLKSPGACTVPSHKMNICDNIVLRPWQWIYHNRIYNSLVSLGGTVLLLHSYLGPTFGEMQDSLWIQDILAAQNGKSDIHDSMALFQ